MPNPTFVPVSGTIQNISPMSNDCCSSMVSIRNNSGITNFVVSPSTYVVQETMLRPGMRVTAFYDASLPVPLIFPPQLIYYIFLKLHLYNFHFHHIYINYHQILKMDFLILHLLLKLNLLFYFYQDIQI